MLKEMHDRLSAKEAAQYLCLPETTLANWRSSKRYDLPYIKVGRRVFYRRSDIDRWLESRVEN